MDFKDTLQQAITYHKSSELEDAERLYRSILSEQTNHPDANHNLGVLLKQCDKADIALVFFKTALEANPNQGQYWISYIDALIHLQQYDDAQNVLNQGQAKGLKGDAVDQLKERLNSKEKPSPESVDTPSKLLNVNATLARAKSHTKKGQLDEAKQLYHNVLAAFPQNQQAKKGLKALQTGQVNKKNPSDPPQAQIDAVISLYSQGQAQEALSASETLIKDYPNTPLLYNISGACYQELGQLEAAVKSYEQALAIKPDYADAHSNLGVTLKELGQLEAAVKNYEQALAIKPDYAEVYNNLGITLQELGQLEAAVRRFEQALAIKPDYAEAHSNLGNTLQELGQLEAAVKRYEQALAIKPDYAEAHSNLGNTLKELGQLEAALKCYEQALAIKPDFAEFKSNLVRVLTSYRPQKNLSHPILRVNQEIRNIALKDDDLSMISDRDIIKLILKSSYIVKKYNLEIDTQDSQAYRSNRVDLNCKRHMSVFNNHNIIPEFCFGCYKVQVEPRTIFELIKLFAIFDELKLDENNTRKCMVELRPEFSGFYKGFIYCSSLHQANQIADCLDLVIKEKIGSGLPAKVKRGCSEFPISFPQYKEINNSGPQLMNYNEGWRSIEESHDSNFSIKAKVNIRRPSLRGLSLNDFLIMRNWLGYAKGIGDQSLKLMGENIDFSLMFFDQAKARSERYPFTH
jgi:tetratricopeptide (TPR) repeat protein